MSAILVKAKIATEIKTLSTREQWPDSAVSLLYASYHCLALRPIFAAHFRVRPFSLAAFAFRPFSLLRRGASRQRARHKTASGNDIMQLSARARVCFAAK